MYNYSGANEIGYHIMLINRDFTGTVGDEI